MSTLTLSNAWLALQDHQSVMAQQHLHELFTKDPKRFNKFSLKFNDILMDYSKHPICPETISLLLALARQQELEGWIDRLDHSATFREPDIGDELFEEIKRIALFMF